MLKILAMILMLIDHLALAFLPSSSPLYLICRLVGRLSMPIFAYKIACGFSYSHHLKSYTKNIALMTLAAQIPFLLLTYGRSFKEVLYSTSGLFLISHWNIGFTFLCALALLYIITSTKHLPLLLRILSTLTVVLLSTLAEYNLYGILTVLLMYYFLHSAKSSKFFILIKYILLFAVLTVFYYLTFFTDSAVFMICMQLPAILSLPIIYFSPDKPIILPKSFFYLFYPIHMFLIALVAYFIVSD